MTISHSGLLFWATLYIRLLKVMCQSAQCTIRYNMI